MPAATETTFNGVPAGRIDRYRKLRALAADKATAPNERNTAKKQLFRMEKEYPGIDKALDQLEAFQKQANQANNGRSSGQPFSVDDAISVFETYTHQNPANWFVDHLFRRSVKWGIDQLRNAEEQQREDQEQDMGRAPKKPKLLSLEERLDELADQEGWQVDSVNIGNWTEINDEAISEDCVEVSFIMPEKLWGQIVANKGFAKRFVDWLDVQLADAPDEPDDGSVT